MRQDQPRQPTPEPASGQPMQVLLLSDDNNLASVIAGLLKINRQPVEASVMSSGSFSPEQSVTADLIVLDRLYGGRAPLWALREIHLITSALGARPANTILLCDQQSIQHDINHFAEAARLGVDRFLLKSELSLNNLLSAPVTDLAASGLGVVVDNSRQSPHQDSILEDSRSGQNTHGISTFGNDPDYSAKHLSNLHRSDNFDGGFLESFENPPGSGFAEQNGLTGELDEINEQPAASDWFIHRLHFDVERETVVIQSDEPAVSLVGTSNVPLRLWLEKLTQASHVEFEQTIEKAVNYHKLPARVACNLRSGNQTFTRGQLINISTQNNGRGRVTGLTATLLVARQEFEIPPLQQNPIGDQIEHSSPGGIAISNRDIIRSLPMICLILNTDAEIQSVVNDSLMRSGLFPQLQSGDKLEKIMTTEQIESLKEEINRCLNTGQNFPGVWSYSTDAGMRWFDTQVSKIRSNAGLERQILWTAFDISDSRENFIELSKKEDTLNQILLNSPLLFFEKDSNGHYRRANKAFCDWVKTSEAAIIGRRDQDIFRGDLKHYLEKLETFVRSDAESNDLFDDEIPETPDSLYRDIKWRGRLLKYRFGDGVESLIGFGFPHRTADNEQDMLAAIPSLSDSQSRPIEFPVRDSERSAATEGFRESGSLKQDFKAILASLVSYTEMAVSQKNELRNRKLLEQIEALDATTTRARELITSNLNSEDGGGEIRESHNLSQLTAEIIEMQRPTLPPSLRFNAALNTGQAVAFTSATEYQKIVLQLISSARDTAIRAADSSGSQRRSIELTLQESNLDEECVACGNPINGDYLELAVHTEEPDLSQADLDQLLDNARNATARDSGKRGQHNVIALTHAQGGHSLITYNKPILTLKLLFIKDK